MLQAALGAGLASEGADVVDVGVIPTPALAWLAVKRDLPAAVISASHNPFADNGIKLFGAGAQAPRRVEQAIEDELAPGPRPDGQGPRPLEGHGVGTHADRTRPGAPTSSYLAPPRRPPPRRAPGGGGQRQRQRAERGGLRLRAAGCRGGGHRLRPRRHQHQRRLRVHLNRAAGRAVLEHGADLGLALDGDADRLLAVDGTASWSTATALALFAPDLADRGELAGNAVVVTVMTNLGFRRAMDSGGSSSKRPHVGDRHVLAALDKDGLLARRRAVRAHHLPPPGHDRRRPADRPGPGRSAGPGGTSLAGLSRLPRARSPDPGQRAGVDPVAVREVAAIALAVDQERAALGDSGRVLVRPSGTEPLVRVMVEAPSPAWPTPPPSASTP